jgi:hypothetical protein
MLDMSKLLAELRAERDLIDEAMARLERLSETRKRPAGRPPRTTPAVKVAGAASQGKS